MPMKAVLASATFAINNSKGARIPPHAGQGIAMLQSQRSRFIMLGICLTFKREIAQ